MRKLFLALAFCAWAASAHAQTLASGSLTTNGQSVTATLSPGGAPVVGHSVQVTGTWTGTLTFQASVDGSTYVSLNGSNVASGASATSTTANGVFSFTNGGFRSIRVAATASMTGTAVVTINQGYAGGGGGGGGAGSVTQGTSPWVVSGEYANDGAAAGTNRVNVNDGIVETAAPIRTNGRNAGASYTAGGAQRVMITDAAGAASTIATDKAEDAAHTDADTGPVVLSRRIDAAASSAGTSGDYATINTDSVGRLWISGAVVEDAAETAADSLLSAGTVRRDTAASSAGTSGDNATLNTDSLGLLWTRRLDPCSGTAKTVLPINISTATTTEITPSLAGASNYYYVCSLVLIAGGADNVALVDDDSDNCGSVTAGMAGGTTAASGFNFAANGGLTFGNGDSTVFKTNGTNRVVCIVTSAAVQLSGAMTVVAAP